MDAANSSALNPIALDDSDDDEVSIVVPPRQSIATTAGAGSSGGGSSSFSGSSGGGSSTFSGGGGTSDQPYLLDDDGGRKRDAPIELSDDDDDDDGGVEIVGETTGEVVEVSAPSRPMKAARIQSGDDDLEIVGECGSFASDLPHARCDCPTTPFKAGRSKLTIEANAKTCAQCYCFVCQIPAAQCEGWQSRDAKVAAHCNAHGKLSLWSTMRASHVAAEKRRGR